MWTSLKSEQKVYALNGIPNFYLASFELSKIGKNKGIEMTEAFMSP